MSLWKQYLPYLTVSVFGLFGITTVLSAATANLESRQKEQYGDAKEYKDWVKGRWFGVCFSRSYKSSSAEAKSDDGETGIELNVSDEAEGTGI